MPRALVVAGLLVTAIHAQAPPLVVLLNDPAGGHVMGAHGIASTRPEPALPALGDLQALAAPAHEAEFLLGGTSDERGLLRFTGRTTDAAPGAASGLVWTDAGLGALVVDLYAGRAQRLVLQPMSEVTTATGAETLTVLARAHRPGGRTVLLPAARGASVRLPAGDYELWIGSGERWTWQRHSLRSGQRTIVGFDGPARTFTTDAATRLVLPAGRPDVRLAGADARCTLCGEATRAPLFALRAGVVHGPTVLGAEPNVASWPAVDARPMMHIDVDHSSERRHQVWVCSLVRVGAESWRVLGAAAPPRSESASQRPEPWARLPAPPDGDTWLLCVAEGYAPQARPWQAADRPAFALERGVPLSVVCRDEGGEPLVDVAVDYEPGGMPAATVAAHSDAYGVARLGPVLGPGRLRLLDARYANQSIELATIPTEPLPVTVTAGETLHGVARWPDGAPAPGVVITLRDPSGALRPAERAVVSGADGAFEFQGLGPHRGLVLFASTQRSGRTWSGKLDRLRAGSGTIELVVRDEDPVLLPR